ncbi:hypothetical protein [Aeromonas caviae]|uniref:hypothetical protein n=1 Tax=Aeromonas caviae TaxID=648 RepID=UPI001269A5CE|nr:hypothetical protein [Aeromonas caviae]
MLKEPFILLRLGAVCFFMLLCSLKILATSNSYFIHSLLNDGVFIAFYWAFFLLTLISIFNINVFLNPKVVLLVVLFAIAFIFNKSNYIPFAVFVFWLLVGAALCDGHTISIFRAWYLLTVITILIMVMFYGQTYYYDGRYGNVPSYGFVNSNAFPQILVLLFLSFFDKKRVLILLTFCIVLFYFYGVRTRSLYLLVILFWIFYAFLPIRKALKLLPYLLSLGSVMLVYVHMHYDIYALNFVLSNRLAFASEYITHLDSIKDVLFGIGDINITNPLDSSFLYIYVHYGLVVLLVFSYIYYKIICHCIENSHRALLVLVSSFLIYNLFENTIINIFLNPTLFIISKSIYANRSMKQ